MKRFIRIFAIILVVLSLIQVYPKAHSTSQEGILGEEYVSGA